MSTSQIADWRTSLVVHGFDLARLAPQGPNAAVVAGLLETATGVLQVALRVGEHVEQVILSLQAASQHIANVHELQSEGSLLSGETLG
jgi:hypothetical protein